MEKHAEPENAQPAEQHVSANDGIVENWEYLGRPPTRVSVLNLLGTLPDAYGVAYTSFVDFILPLSASKKIKVPNPDKPGQKTVQYVDTWSLYMTVAGRIAMLNRIAEANGWRVDIAQDWMDDGRESGRIVLREVIAVWDEEGDYLGVRSGIAHVPYKGGEGPAGSNPYSRVETAARGRAIAAWGIGILPGSGVASVEEMQTVPGNRAAETPTGEAETRSRDDLLEETMTTMARLRQARDLTEEQMAEMTAKRLADLGVRSVWDAEAKQIDWKKPKAGQIALLLNDLRASLRTVENEGMEL